MNTLTPIFPYFGGKRRAAPQIWELFGQVDRYVEPFFGSGAVLLGNPYDPHPSELVNDLSHHVANLWRSIKKDPETVWDLTTAPCSDVELRGRMRLLNEWSLPDPENLDSCDPYMAGLWLYCSCVAIKWGDPWIRRMDPGVGVKAVTYSKGKFDALVDRMARVQVMCGDWKRCVTPAARFDHVRGDGALCAVFLDPPYGVGNGVEYEDGSGDIASEVWEWAVANGNDPKLRIVVAGYEDGRELPEGWTIVQWNTNGGYGNQRKTKDNDNRLKERLWCSPHCLNNANSSVFF